jgi:hypothetical protein
MSSTSHDFNTKNSPNNGKMGLRINLRPFLVVYGHWLFVY